MDLGRRLVCISFESLNSIQLVLGVQCPLMGSGEERTL
jgi:hypothetical protein